MSTPPLVRNISEGCCCPLFSSYVSTVADVSLILASRRSYVSASYALVMMRLRHCDFTQNAISVIPHLFCCRTESPPPPYISSHISVTTIPVVPHLRHHALPSLSSPMPLSAIPIISHLHCASVVILPRLCCVPHLIIFHHPCTLPPSFSAFSARIFSSLFCVLHYTARSALVRTTFLTLYSDLITTLFSSILVRLFYISVMFSLRSNLPRFSPPVFTLICSNLSTPLSSVCSDLLAPSLICSTMVAPLML